MTTDFSKVNSQESFLATIAELPEGEYLDFVGEIILGTANHIVQVFGRLDVVLGHRPVGTLRETLDGVAVAVQALVDGIAAELEPAPEGQGV